ncbi:MAG: hypothetical protein GFGODING_00416 [Flavobacteriales bacterium]|nr:hypothetical protein [Flavobacteriales bacterium]
MHALNTTMDSIIRTLERLSPLTPEQEESLRALQPFLCEVKIKKGGHLHRPGDIPATVAHVEKGIFGHMITDTSGNERILRFYQEGSFIEDCTAFNAQQPIEYAIQALEPCTVSYFRLMEVAHLYTAHPGFEKLGRLMMEGASSENEKHLTMLMRYNAEERYCHLLKDSPELAQRVSVTHLAQYLGINRVTLSKLRRRLVERVVL